MKGPVKRNAMDFIAALNKLRSGQCVTNSVWGRPRCVLAMATNFIIWVIHTDGRSHTFNWRQSDITSNTWLVVPKRIAEQQHKKAMAVTDARERLLCRSFAKALARRARSER